MKRKLSAPLAVRVWGERHVDELMREMTRIAQHVCSNALDRGDILSMLISAITDPKPEESLGISAESPSPFFSGEGNR